MKRKPKPKLPPELKHHKVTVTLSYDVVQFLNTRFNKSGTIDETIKSTKTFRTWKREQKTLEGEGMQASLV